MTFPMRSTFARSLSFLLVATALAGSLPASGRQAVLEIGQRRELFVDGALVDRLTGGAQLRLHHPVPQEISLEHDKPWEGSVSTFHTTFKDGDIYRMYYVGAHVNDYRAPHEGKATEEHTDTFCYAESRDGINWYKPVLGLCEFGGSTANNILLTMGEVDGVPIRLTNPTVFKDENPDVTPDARYKAFLSPRDMPPGILAFKSADGLRWKPMAREPVLVEDEFDSQNVIFWDTITKEYRAYWRYWSEAASVEEKSWRPSGYRGMRTATSQDFIHWSAGTNLAYGDAPPEHLYTTQIKPYYRAPQIYIGFPARYVDRGWTDSLRAMPELEHRIGRARSLERKGTALTESQFMASRDGVNFKRWPEAFLRPTIERDGTWAYGNQFISWQVVETKSKIEGAPNEMSLYAVEGYWTGNSTALRRYTLRLDGFVSVNAPLSGGDVVTKPLRFRGNRLTLNFSTSAAGSVRVELQDLDGKPLPGFSLADCPPIYGDTLERTVHWAVAQGQPAPSLASVADRTVRVRFEIKDGDLYSFQFVE